MRVPASPHNLRKFMPVSMANSDEDSNSEVETVDLGQLKRPPRPNYRKTKEQQRPPTSEITNTPGFHRSRERTRISAVQRLVERKLAQKEKEKEKERDQLFRRSSSVGNQSRTDEYLSSLMSRSLSRERLNSNNESTKTYITISSGGPTRIREHSPSKKANKSGSVESGTIASSDPCIENRRRSAEEILMKNCSPLKSTELLKDITDKNDNDQPKPKRTPRKTSFTTEKTIMVNNANNNKDAKVRKVSIDINYVYEHHMTNGGSFGGSSRINQDEKRNSTGSEDSMLDESFDNVTKRRISLEQRFQARTSSSMSTSSSTSSETSEESPSMIGTPEAVPRQSKQRKTSNFKNINIIHEDEISNDNSQTSKRTNLSPGLNLPKPKTSFHRRFSQDQTSMNINIRRSNSPPVRKISLQNITTINTDSLADQKKEEGNQLYLSKNYREALQRYNEAISLCPGCPAFYGNRAACHMMLGQYVQALEDARTSVQLDHSFVKGYVRVAKCCVALGDVNAAKQAINTALTVSPESRSAFDTEKTSLDFLEKHDTNLRTAFAEMDYRKALYHLEQALKIAKASQRLKLSRAECLAFLGRYQEAQSVANDLLRCDSTNVEAVYIRGLCLYYEDNIDKAFTHFQQVLRLAPDHVKAKEAFKRARLLKTKKDEGNEAFMAAKYDQAYQLYSEALAIDTKNKLTNAKLYFNRATVAAKLKKWTQSVEDCNIALSLDSTYIKAYLRRAKSYMELEKFEEAVRDYEYINRVDRGNFEYRQLLSHAKQELKKSKRKDYYKILGVDRNANEDEVKKAYKRSALTHHPDRHAGASEEEKQEQERKFKEVGEAYAVLSDTKKRSRYDNGHDLDNLVSSSNNSSNHGFSDHHMDASQIFKAFFGNSAAGMHAHSYHHHSGFGAGGPGAAGQMPGNFFQFG